jgi:DNA-binding NarL/FixJ family response regulator
MKVLIVDDSKIIRDRIHARLKEIHQVTKVLEAENAASAYQIIKSEEPDKIILDIRLSDENGLAVLKWVKEKSYNSIVIIFTNYPYPEYERKCKQLGGDHFLNKSSDTEKLFKIIADDC